jgi:hypothetical protein
MAGVAVEVPLGGHQARLIEVATRVLYLVTSHKNPEQVGRLVRTLRRGSPRSPIVIHHDSSRSTLDPALLSGLNDVHVLPFSIPVEWGDFSIVEMNLRCFEWILGHLEFDWLVLLSGQDYPVKPLSEMESFLSQADCDGLLEPPQLVENRVVRQKKGSILYAPVFRYYYRYWRLPKVRVYSRLPARVRRSLRRLLGRALPRFQKVVFLHPLPEGLDRRVGIRRLRTPFGRDFRCYKSSQWFTLSRGSVDVLVRTAREKPYLARYYKRTVIPDESFLQTVLLNQPGWRRGMDNMVFYKWTEMGSGSPDLLTVADLEDLLASGKHFARKFDVDVDAAVLDRLDEHLFASSGGSGLRPRVSDT